MKQNKIPKNEYLIQPKGKTNPYKNDVIYSNLGQWRYPGQVTRIPSNQITMQGVPYPVQGVDDTGYSQMMYPGMDYEFPGQSVTEYPFDQGFDRPLNPSYNPNNDQGFDRSISPSYNPQNDRGFDRPINHEGHYPFGGQNTKTHTHMKKGGWLDAYDEGGGNPSNPLVATSEKSSEENKNFDLLFKYLEEKKRVEGVRSKAAQIAANKAKSQNPSTRTDLSYIKQGAYYCNTHTGECFQDAGATTPEGKKMPVIPGNLQWDSQMKKLGFDWADTPEPGDVAREQLYRTQDYQGNSLSPGWYTSHSGVVTKAGENPNDVMIGNAPGGARARYVNQPVNQMTGGRDNNTVHMKYQRYVGNLPSMQTDYNKIMEGLRSESIPSIPYTYPKEEERDIIPQSNLEYGGDLYEEFRRGGQRGLKKYTSKNIQSSVNDLFRRNETLFGPAGKKRYKPGLTYQNGGGTSIVDYLASKGIDPSKENRQQLAQKFGVKDYDFTAEKNIELLSKLEDLNTNVNNVQKAPVKSNAVAPSMIPFKPIDKRHIYNEEAVKSQPDYSHLSTAAQAQLNKLNKNNPETKKTMDAANKAADLRRKLEAADKAQKDAQRIADRYRKVRESQEVPSVLSKEYWKDPRKNMAIETQATGDKLRFFPNDPNSFIDDYINPFVMIGNMASSLGSAPLRAKEEDSYMPYVSAIGMPLAAGIFGPGLTEGASLSQGLKQSTLQAIDVPGSNLLKNIGNRTINAGNKAINKIGLKEIKKTMPEGFQEATPLEALEKASIKTNKNFTKQIDEINSPKYTEQLRAKGYTKEQAGIKQYEDLVTRLAESNMDDATMNQYLKLYPAEISTKENLMKEYQIIKNNASMTPKRKEGLYVPKESKPLKQKEVINDINAIPKKEKLYLKNQIDQNPLYQAKTITEKVSDKISKKAFENTHMPIASKEQQMLAKKNEVMAAIFGESRTNVAKDIENVNAHIENIPEGHIFLGSNSLSDSSFPLYTMQAKRAISQGKVKPVFLGYSPLNDFGHLTQTGTNQQTVLNHINEQIAKFNSGFEKMAKLPNAYIKDGKIMYPNMALQKGKVSEFAKNTAYNPNYNKIASSGYRGITKKESKPIAKNIITEIKNSNKPKTVNTLVSAPTFSQKNGGSITGWLDNLH
jgi:hypothetical protein